MKFAYHITSASQDELPLLPQECNMMYPIFYIFLCFITFSIDDVFMHKDLANSFPKKNGKIIKKIYGT